MAIGSRSQRHLDLGDDESREMLVAARAGSVAALGRLFESVRGHLMLAARRDMPRRFRGHVGASDVVQDAVAAGHVDFQTFRGGSRSEFFAWMRTILSRTMIDRVRRESAARRSPPGPLQRLSAVGSGEFVLAGDPDESPLSVIVRCEDAEIVGRSLDMLRPDQRRAIWLRHWEGKSFGEIGDACGRSEAAARMLWCRAYADLVKEVLRRAGDGSDRTPGHPR